MPAQAAATARSDRRAAARDRLGRAAGPRRAARGAASLQAAPEPPRGARPQPEGRRAEAVGAAPPASASRRSATSSGTCRTAIATARTCSRSASFGSARRRRSWSRCARRACGRPGTGGFGSSRPRSPTRSGATKAIWFNQAWLLERLRPGTPPAALRQARPLGVQGLGARDHRRRRRARARHPHRRARARSTRSPTA